MEPIQRTIYAAHLQTCKILEKPFTLLPNSTLNQKFNVQADEVPTSGVYPKLNCIAIGNGGETYEVAANNFVLTTPVPHLARHASLYNHIPFVVRPVDDDLSPAERLLYRLRVPVNVGGANYFAYYLRVLDVATVTPSVENRNVSGDTITATPFVPDLSDLSPTRPVISNVNLTNPDGDYLASAAKITFTLNQAEITNIREACQILYGDPRYAVINEIGVTSGVDKIISGPLGAGSVNYTESTLTQIAAFAAQSHNLTASSTSLTIGLNVGSVEPLLV